jgi:hypothetical protein
MADDLWTLCHTAAMYSEAYRHCVSVRAFEYERSLLRPVVVLPIQSALPSRCGRVPCQRVSGGYCCVHVCCRPYSYRIHSCVMRKPWWRMTLRHFHVSWFTLLWYSVGSKNTVFWDVFTVLIRTDVSEEHIAWIFKVTWLLNLPSK